MNFAGCTTDHLIQTPDYLPNPNLIPDAIMNSPGKIQELESALREAKFTTSTLSDRVQVAEKVSSVLQEDLSQAQLELTRHGQGGGVFGDRYRYEEDVAREKASEAVERATTEIMGHPPLGKSHAYPETVTPKSEPKTTAEVMQRVADAVSSSPKGRELYNPIRGFGDLAKSPNKKSRQAHEEIQKQQLAATARSPSGRRSIESSPTPENVSRTQPCNTVGIEPDTYSLNSPSDRLHVSSANSKSRKTPKESTNALLQELNIMKVALGNSVKERNAIVKTTEVMVQGYESQLVDADEQVVSEMAEKWKAQMNAVNNDVEQGVYVGRIRDLESKNMTLRAQLKATRAVVGVDY